MRLKRYDLLARSDEIIERYYDHHRQHKPGGPFTKSAFYLSTKPGIATFGFLRFSPFLE